MFLALKIQCINISWILSNIKNERTLVKSHVLFPSMNNLLSCADIKIIIVNHKGKCPFYFSWFRIIWRFDLHCIRFHFYHWLQVGFLPTAFRVIYYNVVLSRDCLMTRRPCKCSRSTITLNGRGWREKVKGHELICKYYANKWCAGEKVPTRPQWIEDRKFDKECN